MKSEISGIDFLCRGGTHSAWPWQTAYGIQVGGDATLESTSFDGNFIEGSAMYGIGAQTDAALLKVGGDLSANNVTMLNNSLTTGLDCYYRDCYRYQTGGMIWAKATSTGRRGSLVQNTLELTGTLNQPAKLDRRLQQCTHLLDRGVPHTAARPISAPATAQTLPAALNWMPRGSPASAA